MLELVFSCSFNSHLGSIATRFNSRLFPDGFPCRDIPGVVGYLSHFVGCIEPQMRKAEHLHALLGVLGFRHPDEFFATPQLGEQLRRAWHYVASMFSLCRSTGGTSE